jgi:hypothetical protein
MFTAESPWTRSILGHSNIIQPGRFLVAFLAFWSAVAPAWAAEPLCCLVCLCDEGIVDACAARPVKAEHEAGCACCAASKPAAAELRANRGAVCGAVPGPCGKCEVSPPPTAVVAARFAFAGDRDPAEGFLPTQAWPTDFRTSFSVGERRMSIGMANRPPSRASLCVWVI